MVTSAKAGDQLAGFTQPVREWFQAVFRTPTSAQIAAWHTIGMGDNALIIAPTGSGKTLAAFLHSLDRLSREPGSNCQCPRSAWPFVRATPRPANVDGCCCTRRTS